MYCSALLLLVFRFVCICNVRGNMPTLIKRYYAFDEERGKYRS